MPVPKHAHVTLLPDGSVCIEVDQPLHGVVIVDADTWDSLVLDVDAARIRAAIGIDTEPVNGRSPVIDPPDRRDHGGTIGGDKLVGTRSGETGTRSVALGADQPSRDTHNTHSKAGVLGGTIKKTPGIAVLREAVSVWNHEKHANQPAVLTLTGSRKRSLELFLVDCGSLAVFTNAVRAYAASPAVNGTGSLHPFGLDTMIRAEHRSKWVDAAMLPARPALRVVSSRDGVEYDPAKYA